MIDRIRELLEENDIEGVLMYLDLLENRMQEIDDMVAVLRKYFLTSDNYIFIRTNMLFGTDVDIVKKVIK